MIWVLKFCGLLSLLILISACTTVEFVRKDLTPQKLGVLRHYPTSDTQKQAKYKNLIDEKARGFCAGDFEVIKEYQARDVSETSTGVGTGFGLGGRGSSIMIGGSTPNYTMYNFVEFKCK